MSGNEIALPRKSTIGRLFAFERRPLAWLSWLAPALAGRVALRVFSTPPARGRGGRRPELPSGGTLEIVEAGEFRLAVQSWGAGPVVLLVHGWNADRRSLGAMVAPLTAAGYRVLTVDLPAHGDTPGRQANLPLFSAAVQALAERTGNVHAIVAHSLGAAATALALARGLRVERVALLAPPMEMSPFAQRFAAWVGLSAKAQGHFLAELERRVGAPLDSFDLRRALPAVAVEGLVLHDRGDREVPFAHGEAVARAWPGAQFHAVNGLGHTRMLVDPGVVTTVVDFVAGRPALRLTA